MPVDRHVVASYLPAEDLERLDAMARDVGSDDWWRVGSLRSWATLRAAQVRAGRLERVEGYPRWRAEEAASREIGKSRSWLRTTISELLRSEVA